MIRYIYAEDLVKFPKLRRTMFTDRAAQFKNRLNWSVTVDANGYEMDEYDVINPMYVIWEMPDGTHGGSMRLLPTIGKTMVNDHFLDLTDGVPIQSMLIWECTRFCISPSHTEKAADIATALLCAGCEIGLQYGLTDSVGVYDPRMTRIYRRIGWEPTCLGSKGAGKERISVGLWEVSEDARDRMCKAGGWTTDSPAAWFEASFPTNQDFAAIAA